MKVSLITIVSSFIICKNSAFSQSSIKDFKIKTSSNTTERTTMLDILRADLYSEYGQEFIFVVKHFKVSNNYAWFMGTAQRRDGKQIELEDDEKCCKVEALFRKSGGKWFIEDSRAFDTDALWWYKIWEEYPDAPRAIFPNIKVE